MDEKLAFKKADNVSIEQAATLGVGLLVSLTSNPLYFPSFSTYPKSNINSAFSFKTASLGLVAGLGVKYPAAGETSKHDEWLIILSGSGR